MSEPKVVLVTPALPYDDVPHAGGRYVLALHRVLAQLGDVSVVAPGTRTNRAAAGRPGSPGGLVLAGGDEGQTRRVRAVRWTAANLDRRLRRFDQGAPSLLFATDLVRNPQIRALIRSADVIDLQWFDSIRLAPLLHRMNRAAALVGTFHDVQSQSFSRESSGSGRDAAYWQRQAARAHRLEVARLADLDVAITFSEKDDALLGHPTNLRVVRPPLADVPSVIRSPSGVPTVIFVSYLARDENNEAALWLLDRIWPRVLAQLPTAQLRLVGAGASDELRHTAQRIPSAMLTGFVDDLAIEYSRAWASIVPLRKGAGVKFKTVEALVAGVPVVTSPVGAEGIDHQGAFVAVDDDPAVLAGSLVGVLRHPATYAGKAREAAVWARQAYSLTTFRRQITEVVEQARAAAEARGSRGPS